MLEQQHPAVGLDRPTDLPRSAHGVCDRAEHARRGHGVEGIFPKRQLLDVGLPEAHVSDDRRARRRARSNMPRETSMPMSRTPDGYSVRLCPVPIPTSSTSPRVRGRVRAPGASFRPASPSACRTGHRTVRLGHRPGCTSAQTWSWSPASRSSTSGHDAALPLLTQELRHALDELLIVGAGRSGRMPLSWLRSRPTSLSPRALRRELDKRAYRSERIGPEGLDLEALTPTRRAWLAQLGRRSRVQLLRRCYWNPFRLTEARQARDRSRSAPASA